MVLKYFFFLNNIEKFYNNFWKINFVLDDKRVFIINLFLIFEILYKHRLYSNNV